MAKNEIKALEGQIEELGRRIEKLEALVATLANAHSSAGVPAAPQSPSKPEISGEIVLAISAAVAAFLGKRASIRQIRLTGYTAWAQQGRATVQASHGVEFVRGLR